MTDLSCSRQLPRTGLAAERILEHLSHARVNISQRWNAGLFGKPDTRPTPISIEAVTALMTVNPNNSGIHTRNEKHMLAKDRCSPWQPTRDIEKTVVDQVISTLGGNTEDFDGYISSGGSESNLHAIWIGRNILRERGGPEEPIVLIASRTVHNSISKAVDILDLARSSPDPSGVVRVDLDVNWAIDVASLDDKIAMLISKGIRKSIVVLNAGSTLNGVCDDTFAITETLERWHRERGFQYFLHVDAAFGGWVLPFMDDKSLFDRYINLSANSSIGSINLCFHKMGLCPYDSGILIIRRPFIEATRREVSNLTVGYEYTIRGSRSGATACGVWATLNHVGYHGYEEIVRHCMSLRQIVHSRLLNIAGIIKYPLGSINVCPIGISRDMPAEKNQALRNYFEACFIHPGHLSRRSGMLDEEVFALHPMPHHTETDFHAFADQVQQIVES